MTDRDHDAREGDEAQGYVLDSDDSEDLDEAIREALEAVERQNGPEDAAPDGEGESEEEAPVESAQRLEEQPEDPGREALAEELVQLRERLVRTLADFDNFRKRTERERSESRRYEGFHFVREFLGIVDNLERAAEAAGSIDDLKTGVQLILRQIQDLLARFGVQRIETTGELFDPRVHEAMVREEGEAVGEPTVTEEFQAGYSMRDRLLRPARVKVAMPVADSDAAEPGEDAS